MTWYLLDSDAVIDYFNGSPPAMELVEQLYLRRDIPCTCDIVIAEVSSGLRPKDRQRGYALLRGMLFLSASPDASGQAGIWRYDFARRGRQLPTTDCLIAAIAHEHGATLLTGNVKDYPMGEVSLLPLPRSRPHPG